MKWIRDKIETCDLFGERVEFYINRKHRSQTFLGGALAICLIGMIIAATWAIGSDIFFKNEPTTETEDRPYNIRPDYVLNSSSFPFSFSFQDYDQKIYDIPSYFKLEVLVFKTYNANFTTSVEKLEYEKCTYKHFPKLDKSYLNSSGILNYNCIKNQNITVGGYWDSEYIQYAVIRVRLCNNNTDSTASFSCAPREEIEQFMTIKPYAPTIYFMNSIINTKNYTNPIQSFISTQYKNVRINSSKSLNIFIREEELITDKGLIFEDFSTEKSYSYDYSDSDDADPNVDSLLDINLMVSNHKLINRRQYIKVQNILANLGGLYKALSMAFYFLVFFFSSVKMNVKIINKVFQFKIDTDINNRKNIFDKKEKTHNFQNKELDVNNSSKKVATNNFMISERNSSNVKNLSKRNSKINISYSNFNLKAPENFKNNLNTHYNRNFSQKTEKSLDSFFYELKRKSNKRKISFSNSEIISWILCYCCKNNKNSKKILFKKIEDHIK